MAGFRLERALERDEKNGPRLFSTSRDHPMDERKSPILNFRDLRKIMFPKMRVGDRALMFVFSRVFPKTASRFSGCALGGLHGFPA
jgi:hypothetical protein